MVTNNLNPQLYSLMSNLKSTPSLSLPPRTTIEKLVDDALREDIGNGDLSATLLEQSTAVTAHLLCREPSVLCGIAWFTQAFRRVDKDVQIKWFHSDGDSLVAGTTVCKIKGHARGILSAERTALNLLQTLCGTATTTRQYVDAVASTNAQILDTRKTIPAMRHAQKYAVAVGGACNHRLGLFEQILIKENHIAAAGSIAEAVRRVRAISPPPSFFEIEVESLAQLQQALESDVPRIMLDNFDLSMLRRGVELAKGHAELEVSGNVSLQNVRQIAETGVDYISIGALTKHLKAIDFSLRVNNI